MKPETYDTEETTTEELRGRREGDWGKCAPEKTSDSKTTEESQGDKGTVERELGGGGLGKLATRPHDRRLGAPGTPDETQGRPKTSSVKAS
jgi:hypothetical protein